MLAGICHLALRCLMATVANPVLCIAAMCAAFWLWHTVDRCSLQAMLPCLLATLTRSLLRCKLKLLRWAQRRSQPTPSLPCLTWQELASLLANLTRRKFRFVVGWWHLLSRVRSEGCIVDACAWAEGWTVIRHELLCKVHWAILQRVQRLEIPCEMHR